VSDYLIMDVQDPRVETLELTMFNGIGQAVRNWRLADGTRSLDIQNLPTGTYYLEVRINGRSFHKKLLKQ